MSEVDFIVTVNNGYIHIPLPGPNGDLKLAFNIL